MERFGTTLSRTIEGLVKWVIVPVTSVIPFLVSSGILLAVFAALWLGFGVGLATDRAALDAAWQSLAQLPLPLQALALLLFMPLVAGLWIWQTTWPEALRLVLIAAIAGWNLLVFIPRRDQTQPRSVEP